MQTIMISVVILTLNSARTLKQTLSALKTFDEVIIFDTGSKDATENIAKSFTNVKWHTVNFVGFGHLRNEAAKIAKNDWILALDSDEVLSPELIDEIQNTSLEENTVYSLPYHNFFNGRLIKCCGWQNESHIRLYNRRNTCFTSAMVHEQVIVKDNFKIQTFKHFLSHYSMMSIDDFLRKVQKYTSLYAEENQGKKKSSAPKAFFHGFFAFLKSYFFQKGFLYGKEGFIISVYNSSSSFYKYLKLQEKNNQLKEKHAPNSTFPPD